MPGGQRSGLLTQLLVMAASSKSTAVSPVTRGLYVREAFFCQDTPAPPANVPSAPAKEQNGSIVSDRDRLAQHRASPVCASCHQLFDGSGFGLEQYDLMGRWRNVDGSAPLTGEGWTKGLDGDDATFVGAKELGPIVADSDIARACYTRRIVEWARGYRVTHRDAALAREIVASMDKQDMAKVWLAIVSDENFNRRDFAQE